MKIHVIGSSSLGAYHKLVESCIEHREDEVNFFISLAGGSVYYAGLTCNLISSYLRRDAYVSGEHLCSAGIFYTIFMDPIDFKSMTYNLHPLQTFDVDGKLCIHDKQFIDYFNESMLKELKHMLSYEVFEKFSEIYIKLAKFSTLCFDYLIKLKFSDADIKFILREYANISVLEFYHFGPEELYWSFKSVIDSYDKIRNRTV